MRSPSLTPQPATSNAIVSLEDVARLLPGYSIRHPIDRDQAPDHRILLGRDAALDAEIDWDHLSRCASSRGIERFVLRAGDVLLTSRTTSLRAFAVIDPPSNIVVSSQFALIRVEPALVDAAFLAWSLNRAAASGRLRGLLKGSTVPFVPLADLRSFRIALPPLVRQRALARVDAIRRRERQLIDRLNQARDILLDASITRELALRTTS